MHQSRDATEVSSDDAERLKALDNLPPSPSLLQQTIHQLSLLLDDCRQIRLWLEEMRLQVMRREARISQRLREATVLVHSSEASPIPAPPENSMAQPTLLIRSLGKFGVYHNGREIPLGSSKKARAIFRYLSTHPQRRAAKDTLLELFWPDEEVEKATHKLHIAISTLRQAFSNPDDTGLGGEDLILFEDNLYSLNPAINVCLDADEFTDRCRSGERLQREGRTEKAAAEYEAALALYRGDFLPEDLYADWAIAPRARLEEAYLTMLGCLAARHLELGRYTETISYCRQILSRDSFREDAYRYIMRCYSRMGQRNQALREFHTCEKVLQQELGVQPTHETMALYEQIVREEAV